VTASAVKLKEALALGRIIGRQCRLGPKDERGSQRNGNESQMFFENHDEML
jgi:hypothetical protein